jgi:ubiquitin-protein ligase
MAHFMNYNPNNIINNINHIPINPVNPSNHLPTRLKKHRLFLELEYLENNYQEVNVRMIRGKETIIEAKYPLHAIPKHIKFVIPTTYPFKAPEVYIIKRIGPNEMCEYVEENYLYTIHNCHLPRIQRLVKEIQGEDSSHTCLKCRSSISYDNWSPAFQMKHIFEEITKNNTLKRRVSIEIGLEELFKKYQQLPQDLMKLIISYI